MAAQGGRRAAAVLLAVAVVLGRRSGGGWVGETQCDKRERFVLPKGKKKAKRARSAVSPSSAQQWRRPMEEVAVDGWEQGWPGLFIARREGDE